MSHEPAAEPQTAPRNDAHDPQATPVGRQEHGPIGPIAKLFADLGAVVTSGRIQHVGDPAAELTVLEGPAPGRAAGQATGALLVPLLATTQLRLSGDDRIDFLHGQVANDVRGLPVGGCNRALLLNHRGHALAEMTVCRRNDDLYLAVDDAAGSLVEQSLRAHIVFDQVAIDNLEGKLVTLTLQGPESDAVLEGGIAAAPVPAVGRFVEAAIGGATVLVHRSRRCAAGGFDLHLLAADAEPVIRAILDAGAGLGGEEALTAARVAAGIPSAALDAGPGVLPQEAGLEGALSYRKGCYLGQEIMARIEARGNVRRHLYGLELAASPANDQRDVISQADGKTVGRLGTTVRHPRLGWIALALLRDDAVDAAPGSAAFEVGGVPATAVALPFSAASASEGERRP